MTRILSLVALDESVPTGVRETGVSKDHEQLFICPLCNGTQLIVKWKRAKLSEHPEVEELPTTELCPMCDGSGNLLGPSD